MSPPRDIATKRVLVCDDNGPFRRVICRELIKLGYAVTQADDATEAARLVIDAEEPCEIFDAIVLDYFMRLPSITGGEAANLIRRHCPEQPIVFISGAELPDDIRAREIVLQKPADLEQIVDAIGRAIRCKADTEPPGPMEPELPTNPVNPKGDTGE